MRFQLLRAFSKHRGASVSIIAAIALPVLIGFVALAGEFGHGLITKTENQRVADLSAYAGALAYASKTTTAAMTAQAQNVAVLNGLASSSVAASLVTSPRTPANSAVYVKISTTNVLLLAPVLRSGSSLPVAAYSYAQLAPTASACMLALSASGTGVVLSGGTTLSSPSCTVASNTTIAVPCGTTLTAKAITYNGTVPTQPCSGISGTITKLATTDPLSTNTGITTAAAHASSLSSLADPTAPNVSTGSDVTFTYGLPTTQAQILLTAPLCIGLFNFLNGTWTVTCPSGGTYYFGNLINNGGVTVNFNTLGSAATTYNINGSIVNSGTAMNFGPGIYTIEQGILNTSTMTFGAGSFKIGPDTSQCSGPPSGGYYSICNNGSLAFAGPSTFIISNGIFNNYSTLSLGSGSTNSYNIGPSNTGYSLIVGGSSTTTFFDTGSGLFQFTGNFNAAGGGSCVILGAATQHDFGGYLSATGALSLGAGVYSVYGYIAFGASGGGDASCNGSTIGVSGTNVTLVTAGAPPLLTSGSCAGSAFCIASGYNHVSLVAPTTGTYAYLGVIGPVTSSNTAGFFLAEGATATSLSGALYFPYGPLTLSGGASIVTSQCLQIVASQISLSGGTSATASNCFSGSSSGASVKLVQ